MKKIRRLLVFVGVLALFAWGCGPSAPPPPPPPPTIPTTTLPPAPKTFTVPDVGIEMVPIPAGKFTMGSFKDEAKFVGAFIESEDEGQHSVEITQPFWMSTLEVTQKQWLSLTGTGIQAQFNKMFFNTDKTLLFGSTWVSFKDLFFLIVDDFDNPSELETFLRKYGAGIFSDKEPDRPMSCVSYEEALQFCSLLTSIERTAGRLPDGYVYSLPTEAQWEYACRAGTVTAYGGDVVAMGVFFRNDKGSGGKADENDYYPKTRFGNSTGKANKWGLFDMHGNLAEWCLDWYGRYPSETATYTASKDPVGPRLGEARVYRGGSFISSPAECRSAYRSRAKPNARDISIGFRVVLVPRR